MDFGFEFDMDWVLIAVSVIVAVTAAVILSRQKKTAANEVKAKVVEPEIPTLTEVVDPIHFVSLPLPEAPTRIVAAPAAIAPPVVEQPAMPDPLARWNSAPSQWAKFTFMSFAELTHVAAKNNMSATQVSELFSAYNKKLQLPGLYDATTNLYAFQRLEITDKKVYEPDIDGAADRYIAQQFPAFVVKKIA